VRHLSTKMHTIQKPNQNERLLKNVSTTKLIYIWSSRLYRRTTAQSYCPTQQHVCMRSGHLLVFEMPLNPPSKSKIKYSCTVLRQRISYLPLWETSLTWKIKKHPPAAWNHRLWSWVLNTRDFLNNGEVVFEIIKDFVWLTL